MKSQSSEKPDDHRSLCEEQLIDDEDELLKLPQQGKNPNHV